MRRLLDYSWPGNIRELQNVLERAIVLNTGRTIEHVDLPEVSFEVHPSRGGNAFNAPLNQWLQEKEKEYLAQKLDDFGGNGRAVASPGAEIDEIVTRSERK